MALTKEVKVDKIEIVGDFKHIQVRSATIVSEDGIPLSQSYHRHVIAPGDDLSNETNEVRDLALLLHRQDVIDAYQAHLAEQNLNDNEG